MGKGLKQFLKNISSLHLTVLLLGLATILVYVGTLAQIESGIWAVQKKYFHSFFVMIDVWNLPWPFAKGIPFPGGYLIGGLLLINSTAAHIVRFKLAWKRMGIILIHFSLILLLVGELFTSIGAVETRMTINEGQTVDFAQDIREAELVLIDPTNPEYDKVVAIPPELLIQGETITHPGLPFDIFVNAYYRNTFDPRPIEAGERTVANAGIGLRQSITPAPPVSGIGEQTVNLPGGYFTIVKEGGSLGTYMESVYFENPQTIMTDTGPWLIDLRFRRYYKPYSITLEKFSHDRFIGTNIARNFSSDIYLNDPEHGVKDRKEKIWMNHPLRYRGDTLFQASFQGETTTILQVVRNPVWTVPYVACLIGGFGMLIHFGISLAKFIGRTSQ